MHCILMHVRMQGSCDVCQTGSLPVTRGHEVGLAARLCGAQCVLTFWSLDIFGAF